MPLTAEERRTRIEGIVVALYDLADRMAAGGLRQATVDGLQQSFRSHAEVFQAIRMYEQQLRWLDGGRRVFQDTVGEADAGTDPEGPRGG